MVKLAPALIVVIGNPKAGEPFNAERVTKILSPAAMFVFATVTVPATSVALPIKSVTAPPFIEILVATDVRLKSVEQLTAPEPAVIFTAVAPVALPMAMVLAAASAPMLIVPVPVTNENAPFVVVQA